MGSKIVNMRNDKNNEGNYSAMLGKLIDPFLDKFPPEMPNDDIIHFACDAWNMACLSQNTNDDILDTAFDTVFDSKEIPELFIDTMKKMIKMKKEKFSDYNELINDFDIEEKDGGMFLSVYTISQDDYFDQELDDLLDEEFFDDEFEFDDSDFYPGYIDRAAIFVKPKQPMFEWFDEFYPEEYIKREYEPKVYLISDDNLDIEKWLKKNYDKIFVKELESWNENEKTWPQKRTYKMFKQWFDVDFGSIVYDLEKDPVIKGV